MAKPVRRMTRPEHEPVGYEWLHDAFVRDVGNNDKALRERARSALAEGMIKAILRTPFGNRHKIPRRMWDKEPVARKVYRRFVDGWMKMHLGDSDSPYAEGWVFVPEGSLKQLLITPQAIANSEQSVSYPELKLWYREYVKRQLKAGHRPSRDEDLAAARQEHKAIIPRPVIRELRRDLAPAEWKHPGPRNSGQN